MLATLPFTASIFPVFFAKSGLFQYLPLNGCSDSGKHRFDRLISTINMKNLCDLCHALCGKPCQNHRCTAPQIRCSNRCTGKLPNAFHHSGLTGNINLCPHLQQGIHMTIAIFKDGFFKNANAICSSEHCHDNCLCIGRKSWMRHGGGNARSRAGACK